MSALGAWTYAVGSTTNGVEGDTYAGGGAVTINATGGRCGIGSLKIKNMTSGTRSGMCRRFINSVVGDYYAKFDLWYTTVPNVLNTICHFHDTTSMTTESAPQCLIKLTTAGKLQLFETNATGQTGSDSDVLRPGRNVVELYMQTSTASNQIAARLNGTTFADSGLTRAMATSAHTLRVGGNLLGETCTSGEWEISDVGVFSEAGGADNSWIGDRAVYTLFPASAGDFNEGTDTGATGWDTVDEHPPDDVTTYHTIVTQSANPTSADRLDVRLTPWRFGIQSGTNPIVFGSYRGMPASNASCNFILRAKTVASSSNITESAPKAVTGTAWITNDDTAASKQPPLIFRVDPEAGGALTAALLNSLQLGVRSNDTTPNPRISAMWADVLFSPASLPIFSNPQRFYRRLS